jgi:MFS family permease
MPASGISVARPKRLTLLAAIMGSFVAGLDATAVNVALPAIWADLGGSLAGQQWVSIACLPSLGSLIPGRRAAGRHLRRAPGLLDRRRWIRPVLSDRYWRSTFRSSR